MPDNLLGARDMGELYRRLIEQYQDARTRGIAANEGRYSDILSQYNDLHSRTMQGLENVGQQQASDIRGSYQSLAANNQQRLTDVGLGNTTVASTMRAGATRDQTSSLQRLAESLAQMRTGADANLTQAKLGFMERREDTYPGLGEIANLAQSIGNSKWGSRLFNNGGSDTGRRQLRIFSPNGTQVEYRDGRWAPVVPTT